MMIIYYLEIIREKLINQTQQRKIPRFYLSRAVIHIIQIKSNRIMIEFNFSNEKFLIINNRQF